jgi:hypothetical protein
VVADGEKIRKKTVMGRTVRPTADVGSTALGKEGKVIHR